MEADDLAAILTERFVSQGKMVHLITRDKDWLQIVQSGVIWEDHKTRECVSLETFEAKTGFNHPLKFLDAKALEGDMGDNLPGVDGIGAVKAKQLIDCFGSVYNFLMDGNPEKTWSEWGKGSTKKLPKPLRVFHEGQGQERFHMNIRLMNLVDPRFLPPVEGWNLVHQKPDFECFRDLCKELGFASILRDFEKFTSVFKIRELEYELG